jgi:hypothetical protein
MILKMICKHLHIQLNKTGKGEPNNVVHKTANSIFQCLMLSWPTNGNNEKFLSFPYQISTKSMKGFIINKYGKNYNCRFYGWKSELPNDFWNTWKHPFMALYKPCLIVDHYGWTLELTYNFWWEFSILNFNRICGTGPDSR